MSWLKPKGKSICIQCGYEYPEGVKYCELCAERYDNWIADQARAAQSKKAEEACDRAFEKRDW